MKDEGVKTLHTGKDIPAGEFVMVVPPNKLVAGDSVVPGNVAFKVPLLSIVYSLTMLASASFLCPVVHC
jgi:hypothetical protein